MRKETGITKQDVTILQAYSSEFGKLPAKMKRFQKAMETTERLLNEFAQTKYTASIFLDDQVTPVLASVSGELRDFSKNTYKVAVSVDMRQVYTDIYTAERKIRRIQLQPSYGGGYVVPYAGRSSWGGTIPVQTADNKGFFDGAMSAGSAIVMVNGLGEVHNSFNKLKKLKINNLEEYAKFKAGIPKSVANAITAFGVLDGGADIAEGVFSSDNAYDTTYKVAEGTTIVAGSLGGMKAGAALGGTAFGPLGMIVGAAGGYLLGKILSEPVADSFTDGINGAEKYADVSSRAAEKVAKLKAEQKELAGIQMDKKFGKIAMSANEVSQVVGELFDAGQTMRINNAAVAISDIQGTFAELQQVDHGLQKNLWLSSTTLGAKNAAENMAGLMYAAESFGASSEGYLLDSQYASREAVKTLMGESEAAEGIIGETDAYYQEKLEKLNAYNGKLDEAVSAAAADGTIDGREQKKIDKIRQDILQLLYGKSESAEKNQQDTDFQAALEKVKMGSGKGYSKESFAAILQKGTEAANERVDFLEDIYSYAAVGRSDQQKQDLLWGSDGKGQIDGLYKQEIDTYGVLADAAMEEFQNKFSEKLGFLDQLGDELERGKFSKKTRSSIMNLQRNEDGQALVSEFFDNMEPLYNKMQEIAQVFSEKGAALPEAVQSFMDKMELLSNISQKKVGDWYLKHYDPGYTQSNKKQNQPLKTPGLPEKLRYNPNGAKYRGGIIAPAFADGGYVHGGAQLITVAEEGTPEAIIPLGRHRRKRAMELFNQVGSYLQAPGFSPKGFAAGGIVGGSIGGLSGGGGTPLMIEVGGVEIKIEAKDGQSLVETIRENKEAISEEIAGVFNAAFRGQFANTPATGGAGL